MEKSQRHILTAASAHPQPSTIIPQPFRLPARRPSLAQGPNHGLLESIFSIIFRHSAKFGVSQLKLTSTSRQMVRA